MEHNREKQIEEMANAIFEHCNSGLFYSEAERIAHFVIEQQGYSKASEVALEVLDDLEEELDNLDTYGYTEEGCDACVTFEDVRRLFERFKKKYTEEIK